MELTAAALSLNTIFAGYDEALLGLMHRLAGSAGGVLTPLCKLITLLGEKGLLFFAVSIALMLFPKTRRAGVCMFGAVCCGALITNVILKDMIARPRPFQTVPLYREFWNFIGAPAEDGYSFPSGHVTAAAAGMVSLCLSRGRKHRHRRHGLSSTALPVRRFPAHAAAPAVRIGAHIVRRS